MSKKKLLFVYDYFFPGYKAGGPIQSLTNLILSLQQYYEIAVVTSGYDLLSEAPYQDVEMNTWNKVILPGSPLQTDVWYAERKGPSKDVFKTIITNIKPDHIYLNGMFSIPYFLNPLMACKNLGYSENVIICPRGMLQSGALTGKALKKQVYLNALRLFGLVNKAKWHATNVEEKADILKCFAQSKNIVVAENIPKKPIQDISFPTKKVDELKLIYLSLIAEKKNLLLLLQLITQIKPGLSLEVYGPPKDTDYWRKCEEVIKTIPNKVQYMGNVKPVNVQQVLSSAHVFILPTKGENFGHALYESLSVGRPVITSFFTPWNNLEQIKAGFNVDIANDESLILAIEKFKAMDQQEYNEYCRGAHQLADNYYEQMDALNKYKKLFS
jgi:glycosyltransferase involved in cell wall biosynthesis